MNDRELADKVEELGVGNQYGTSHAFVRDWRVAGALMERCKYLRQWSQRDDDQHEVHAICKGISNKNQHSYGLSESLPRAIIEACVLALEVGNE